MTFQLPSKKRNKQFIVENCCLRILEGQKIYLQYGATKTLHVFLLDKNLVVKYIGAIDDNCDDASGVKERYLENAITSLENGKDPSLEIIRAIGCSIKTVKKV